MATAAERRRAFLEDDPDYDPYISFDINEYLIEYYPQLNAKMRKSVWTTVQSDPDFDYTPIEEQIDAWVDALFNEEEED